MKISIKREQNQASLSFAERKKFRPKVKQKRLLLLLALLMTAATGAWAQSAKHVITATYDKQTRSLEQPLPYETTVGALYEAVTGEPISDLLTIMTALETPLTEISSGDPSVVSIGELTGASTPVTVKADGEATVRLTFGNHVKGIFVSVVPPLYVTMADGTKDAAKWTATVGTSTTANPLPVGGLSEKDAVTLTYGGRLKVKSVKATSAPSVPDGALSGVFSVSDTKKVNFSKGNLQAVCTSADNNPSYPETFTWQFAENQWDYIGADNNKVNGNGSVSSNCTIDVFGWSTSSNNFGIHNSKTDGDYSGDFVDWGTAIGSGWRTLTHDEWNFLLQSRTTTSGLLFAKANLFGTVHGLILFPDNYTHPDGLAAITAPNDATGNAGWNGNQYTAEEWAKMEAAGAVFLPAAGCREGTTNYNFNAIGYYHTATPADANKSYDVAFHASVLEFYWNQPNHWAFSVRLVREVATSDAAPAGPKAAKDATAEDLGKVIGADGNIYDDADAATAANTTALAKIFYVGSDNGEDAPYNHGLALALGDVSDTKNWCSQDEATCLGTGHQFDSKAGAKGDMAGIDNTDALVNNTGHTHDAASAARGYNSGTHPTGTSAWFLPSAGQWDKMATAAGSYANLINNAGLQGDAAYWSSTEGGDSYAWFFDFSNGGLNTYGKDYDFQVRACLAF